jgi:lipopolysaccharide transport system permease protein
VVRRIHAARPGLIGEALMITTLMSPTANAQTLREIVVVMHKYRELLVAMTRRDLTEQYAGQVFGSLWAIAHPVLLMALFVFVFGYVFRTRIGGTPEMPLDYTTYLLSGLIPWLGFQQAMTRGAVAITAHANLVKQVVFPIEILPVKMVLASAVPALIGFAILLLYVVATHGVPPATYLLMPVLMAIQLAAMLGAAFLLAAVTTFLRDMKEFVQLFSTYGVYVLPVFYLPQWVPEIFRPMIYANPFSYMIWCYQDALYFGRFEHPWAWVIFGLSSVASLALGYRVFRRLKPYFGNVL